MFLMRCPLRAVANNFFNFSCLAQFGPMELNGEPASKRRKIDESGLKRGKIHESKLEVRRARRTGSGSLASKKTKSCSIFLLIR
jgi:hypothetical protein